MLTEVLRRRSFLKNEERPGQNQWAEHHRFAGKIGIELKGEAYRTAKKWKGTRYSILTDGSLLEGGGVGAAAM